jgi:hypothetical protein
MDFLKWWYCICHIDKTKMMNSKKCHNDVKINIKKKCIETFLIQEILIVSFF